MFNKKAKIAKLNKLLEQSIADKDFSQAKANCNDSQLDPLLDKGQAIFQSAVPSNQSNEEFKNKLFKQILQARKDKNVMQPQKSSQPRQSFNFFKSSGPYLVPVTAIMLLIVVISSVFYFGPQKLGRNDFQKLFIATAYAQDNFTIQPTDMDSLGINTTSEFVLKSKVPVDMAKLKESLQVEPVVPIEIEQVNEQEFVIKPQQALQDRETFKIALTSYYVDELGEEKIRLYNWAYEVKRNFKVVSTLPGDKEGSVPSNIGIEMTFSHDNYSEEDFAKYLQIEPALEGRLEKHKRTMVFVPKKMQEATIYKVTIKVGLPLVGSEEKLDKDYVFNFETGIEERNPYYDQPFFNFSGFMQEIKINDPAMLFVYTNKIEADKELAFNLYRFPSTEKFISVITDRESIPDWAYQSRQKWEVDSATLEKYSSFNTKINKLEYREFIQLPTGLPQGSYLLETEFNKRKVQYFLQVTNIATYISDSQSKIMVWANDLATKKPLANTQIKIVNANLTAQTNEQGVAMLDRPELGDKMYNYVFQISTANDSTVSLLPSYTWVNEADNYWSYLYTDRPVYLPTDSIRFWGVVKNRTNPQAEKITVELGAGGSWNYFTGETDALITKELTTSANGTFEGEIAFTNLNAQYYPFQVKIGDKVVLSNSVEIKKYTKPAYKLEISQDKQAAFVKENVNFTIKASFFEGTPVANLKIRFAEQEYTTDQNGQVKITLAMPEVVNTLEYLTYTATPVLAEEADIAVSTLIRVFGPKVFIESKATRQDNKAIISGQVNFVDLTNLNNKTGEDYLGAVLPNQSVKNTVTETYYTEEPDGEEYDFINKVVRKKYKYVRQEKVILVKDISTGNQGTFTFDFVMEKGKDYSIVSKTTDVNGREAVSSTYIWSGYMPYKYWLELDYLRIDNQLDETKLYDVGEQVTLYMKSGESIVPTEPGTGFLFYQARNGIQEYKIQDSAIYQFEFANQDIPNVYVYGVWFNGHTYKQTYESWWDMGDDIVRFNYKSKELNIKVDKDKEKYQPGENVNLSVTVTDKKDKPVSAEVNINLVDEAYYALFYDSRPDPLAGLYRPLSSGVFANQISHKESLMSEGAERGGGEGVRKDFRDRAYFATATTDNNGKANVSFKLPDNITSWRITSQAISPDLYAGISQTYLPVSLPFFITTTWNNEYLVADKPIVRLRAYGDQLVADQDVTYTINIPSLDLKDYTVKGKTFQPTDIELPALKEGTHDFTVTAQYQSYQDGVKKPLKVISSRLLKSSSQYYELSENINLQGNPTGTTRLMFMDKSQGQFYYKLMNLSYMGGDRVEQELSRITANKLLNQYFSEELSAEKLNAAIYQKDDGGIAILPYGSSDLELSARIACLSADQFRIEDLKRYFFNILANKESSPEEISLALYGLAGLGESVMTEINTMMNRGDLKPIEKLYLALASSQTGAGELARKIYQELLSQYGEVRDPYIRLAMGEDKDDYLHVTVLAAILAADLDMPEKNKLWSYVNDNWPKEKILALEEITFIAKQLKYLNPGAVSFTMNHHGKDQKITLDKGQSYSLTVLAEDLPKLKFSNIKGSVGVVSFFQTPLAAGEIAKDPNVSVNHEFFVNGQKTTQLKDGDVVQVRVNYKVSDKSIDSNYMITDILPSGLKVTTQKLDYDKIMAGYNDCQLYYPYDTDDQIVKFYFWRDWSSMRNCDYISYYARVVSTGTYVAEESLIQGMDVLGSLNLGDRQTISIK